MSKEIKRFDIVCSGVDIEITSIIMTLDRMHVVYTDFNKKIVMDLDNNYGSVVLTYPQFGCNYELPIKLTNLENFKKVDELVFVDSENNITYDLTNLKQHDVLSFRGNCKNAGGFC